MELALVHDYLVQLGGAEKVFQNIQGVFPKSPIFVLLNNYARTGAIFDPRRVHSSWLQKIPGAIDGYQWYLMLMPRAIESFNFENFDVILSSSFSFSKGVRPPQRSLHICYCHTPTRYLWHDAEHYVQELRYNKLIKKVLPFFLNNLKNWDYLAAQNVDRFIANSLVVKERIKKYYHRDATVIYPPVETDIFKINEHVGDYYLIGGRLVAYKRYDLAVRAFNKLGIKLKIFGVGPELRSLQKMAKSNIEFLGEITDQEKVLLYSRALAFIHPQIEDFGITAVESMSSGRPVIAYFDGGAKETVIAGQTGEFFQEQNWECLANKIIHFQPEKYDPVLIKKHAEKFSQARFCDEIKSYVSREWENFRLERIFKIRQ